MSTKFEQAKWGLSFTFTDQVCVRDLDNWIRDLAQVKLSKPFHVLFNFIDANPLCGEASKTLQLGITMLMGKGMARSVILFDSSAKIVELMSRLKYAGFDHRQRFISTYYCKSWEKHVEGYLNKGEEVE